MSIQSTPSIYTVISRSNPTGVFSSLPNSYISNLIFTPISQPSSQIKGQMYYNQDTDLIEYWNGNNWLQSSSYTGPQGFQGLVGSDGFQGLVGSDGFQGLVGSDGFQGLVGSDGFQGFQGVPGEGGSGTGTSQWISSTGGIIYYSSGSVGIGKANPTVPLDVVGTVSITGTLNISGNISYATSGSLINPIFQNYKETVFIATSSSSSYIVNCSTGNNFGITLTTPTTSFTFSGIAPTGTLTTVNLFLTQDSSGNRTATWPSSVSWGNPSTPILSTIGGSTDILSFTTFTGGSKWFGFLSGRGF